ncbi:unnamed protein product [Mesocestoides corti]|uniref:TAF6_C domain-containing protein n=1 Tax=Mesocestoides corti TaxID=53468 RepID=A0A0R3UJD7_MESCO|nr:unnamed protein product [Mesocestoides corti]
MDSEERRKINRLSRKVCSSSSVKKRLLKNRITSSSGKSSLKGKKHVGDGVHSSKSSVSKHVDFSLDFFKTCAEMNAVAPFSGEGTGVLQRHLHQITTALVQTSLRIMEQHRRGTPHTSDIDSAALSMGLDVPYGAASGEVIMVRTNGRNAAPGAGGKMFFIRKDKEVDIKTLLRREPSPVIYDISLGVHWLAVDGVQPASPQNPPPDFLRRMSILSGTLSSKAEPPNSAGKNEDSQQTPTESKVDKGKSTEERGAHLRAMQALHVERRPHEISQELMLFFREITEGCVGANEARRHDALENAALDTGLQPLLPYLVNFITEGVRVNVTNNNLAILIYLMRLTKALIDNQHISLEAYLHLLVPTVITCILCRHLCAKPITDNHWALRDYAAKQLVTLCNRYNTSSNGLYNRITRELYRALCTWIDGKSATTGQSTSADGSQSGDNAMDATPSAAGSSVTSDAEQRKVAVASVPGVSLGLAVNSLNTLYGMLSALSEFGPNCLRMLVFPRLPALCKRLTQMTSTSVNPSSSDTPASAVVMDQEGLHQTVTSATALSHAEMRSMESLKKLMTTRLMPLLADWRARQNMPNSLEAYKADYGAMASTFLAPHQFEGNRQTATTAGALIVTKLQPLHPSPH